MSQISLRRESNQCQPVRFSLSGAATSNSSTGHSLDDHSASERRRLAWHLPDDFNSRSFGEQEEILAWVNRVIISGSTEYRAFQAAAIRTRYAVRFRAFQGGQRREEDEVGAVGDVDDELRTGVVDAPPQRSSMKWRYF